MHSCIVQSRHPDAGLRGTREARVITISETGFLDEIGLFMSV
jgi:hypothetical protein